MSLSTNPLPHSTSLLLDADDTLWENSIYFEEAIEAFLTMMKSLQCQPRQVREMIDQAEQRNIIKYGYGTRKFTISLKETFLQLCANPCLHPMLEEIEQLGQSIAQRPIELLAGVQETLPHLSSRYSLILFTKGNTEEQNSKVARSGLANHFRAVEVTREKNVQAYLDLVARYNLIQSQTWMIGNSPKSDINPALEAGINAIYIPHSRTWELELEEIREKEKVIVLKTFGELQGLF